MEFLYELGEDNRILFTVFFFIIGLCIGSFLNVCIYRLPKDISLIFPKTSFCPRCKKPIRWRDNIPLISFFILKGRCRNCHRKISIRYPIVELISGVFLAFLFNYAGLTPELFWSACFVFVLMAVAVIDYIHLIIPDELTLTGIVLGWTFAFLFPEIFGENFRRMALGESVMGMAVGGGLIWLMALLGDLVFKRESVGGGDIKLMAMIGAFLGVQGAILTFFMAPFFALPFGLYQKWKHKNSVLPYGPFLALAAIFNVFFADLILSVILWTD